MLFCFLKQFHICITHQPFAFIKKQSIDASESLLTVSILLFIRSSKLSLCVFQSGLTSLLRASEAFSISLQPRVVQMGKLPLPLVPFLYFVPAVIVYSALNLSIASIKKSNYIYLTFFSPSKYLLNKSLNGQCLKNITYFRI